MSLYWRLTKLQLDTDDENSLVMHFTPKDELNSSEPKSPSVFNQLPNVEVNNVCAEQNFYFGSREGLRQRAPELPKDSLQTEKTDPKNIKRPRSPTAALLTENKAKKPKKDSIKIKITRPNKSKKRKPTRDPLQSPPPKRSKSS